MKQRGRKDRFTQKPPRRNVASFAGGGVSTPPADLPTAAAAIWRRVAAAMPPGWFRPQHREMLAAYCRHSAAAERFAGMLEAAEIDTENPDSVLAANRLSLMAEREQRAALALARSMRMTHQAQVHKETAGRLQAQHAGQVIDWTEAQRSE